MSAPAHLYSPIPAFQRHAEPERAPRSWAYAIPWAGAVLLAPLWFGAVSTEAQLALAAAISVCLLFAAGRVRIFPAAGLNRAALVVFLLLSVLAIVPLPLSPLKFLNPVAAHWGERLGLPKLPMSLAPGETLVRLWQIGIVAAVFLLARQNAAAPHFTGVISYGAAGTMIALAASEAWLLIDGKGIWAEVRHYPAGTFANRNHFASWMAMGSMFVFGALVRKVRHIRAGERSPAHAGAAALLGAGLLAGIASIVACGSRGGMLALGAGLAAWVWMLRRERTQGSGLLVLGASLVAGVAAFGAAGELFMRRIAQDGLGFKWQIWSDALRLWAQAPLAGVGLGAFEPAFNAHKTFHGDGTFLYAENEYIQWLVETGIAGTICLAVLAAAAIRILARPNGAGRFHKAEFYRGAIAALAAFAAHAMFEFVAHVMSLAVFAALLLGVAIGLKERSSGPAVARLPVRSDFFGALALAAFIGSLASLQAAAGLKWSRGAKVMIAGIPAKERSAAFALWPADSARAIVLARQLVQAAEAGQIDWPRANALALATIDRALAWRPIDWELRLERAWLRASANPELALPEALSVIELNPLQPKVPLRFAATFASLHPPSALELLRRAKLGKPHEIKEALRLAWKCDPRPALLWELAPATPAGMKALAEFAREQNLAALAREAEARAANDDAR